MPGDQRVLGVLHEHAAAGWRDRQRPGAAVVERAGEHDRDGVLPTRASERNIGSAAGRTPFSFGPRSSSRPPSRTSRC